MARIILTDIEGTTSAIDFVHRVLFPYARARLPEFVRSHGDEPEIAAAIAAVREETGTADLDGVIASLVHWIDIDRKATPLKLLQGKIWRQGYEQRDFSAHVYADAHDVLARWFAAGTPLYVYSSGSIEAQQLFFAHSVFGNLLPWFRGHFDTTCGGKREASSYQHIANAIGVAASDILFLSDVEAELDAARTTGMETVQLCRADTRPESHGRHTTVDSFHGITL